MFKAKRHLNELQVDIHSHLVPCIDDGVQSWEEALLLIRQLEQMGFRKLITTPHIIHGHYPNDAQSITHGVHELNRRLNEAEIYVQVEAAAEYFADEYFFEKAHTQDKLLGFGDQYILIETAFISPPIFFKELIFRLHAKGLKPVLAHPERYQYLQKNYMMAHELSALGLLFQVNANSLHTYSSKATQKLAKYLINRQMVHFVGSDLHHQKHLDAYRKAVRSRLFKKCCYLPLLNYTL